MVLRRAGRSEIVCGWLGRAQSRPTFSEDGDDGRPRYESIGIQNMVGETHLLSMCLA